MNVGDMVTHRTNPAWSRGKIFSIVPGQPPHAMVLWGNGDLEKTLLTDIEPMGWNLHQRGHKN